MVKKHKLIEVRSKRNYSQDYIAGALEIDVSSYSRKENGKIRISDSEWLKLTGILDVPIEDIYESDESMIFVFNDNATGNEKIVNNYTIPQSIWESQKKYIEKLEEEIKFLRKKLEDKQS
jgi:DNA-binding XRE family transcriptional regulator